MNKYQEAYQNVQAELPHNSSDIVVLRELVEKSIPKKPKKLKKLKLYMCPTCGNAGLTRYARNGRNENYYCYDCGQKLKWSGGND